MNPRVERALKKRKELMSKALSEGQRKLLVKHGTPAEFAVACYEAVPGWISMAEAQKAVADYEIEWDAAE